VQARNQALQLERIEQQMSRIRVVHENSIEESRKLLAEMRLLRSWVLGTAVVMFVLLLVTIVMVTVLLMHS
jgi:cephalosporin hydroxylase